MRKERRFLLPVVACLILLGMALAFDRRFVPFSHMSRKPELGIYIYSPTALFAFVGLVQFLRGRIWPAVAFAIGLICTGLFHQYVVGFSYGNPGYMAPTGHTAAPFVSVVAYSFAFLIVWGIVRVSRRERRTDSQDDPSVPREDQENSRST